MHRQAELVDIDIGRDHRPVPAHVELIVWGEYTFVENFERRFQERRTGPLQDHRPLLWKVVRDRSRSGTAGIAEDRSSFAPRLALREPGLPRLPWLARAVA